MKKLAFVFFVLAVVLGSAPMHAQFISSAIDDDEREIPLDPLGPKEGGPVARSIIIQPASAYLNSDIVTVVFNKEVPTASVSVINVSTGENVFLETRFSPELITLDLNAKDPGEYYLKIEMGETQLSGYFTR